MSWDLQLDEASFAGIKFTVLEMDDSISARRIAQHKYPYRDGADLDDMGREPRTTRMTVVFYGADYESNLGALIEVADSGESDTFRHPILGQWQARISIQSIQHRPDDRDSATCQIEIIEDGTSTVLPTLFSINALETDVKSWAERLGLTNVWGYSEITSAVSAAQSFAATAQSYARDITSKINQVRKKIDKANDKLKELTDVENYKAVKACKRLAYSCQLLGKRIQNERPPAKKKEQPVQAPIVILAQKLYGKDSQTRADELITLNNIKNPMFTKPGEIKVYTR